MNNLTGSATGQLGSDTPPRLFAARERNQRLVILFDEIDKAHEDILQALMQLVDEGALAWSQGEADFRECVIAFTSNARRREMVALKTSFQKTGRATDGIEFQNAVRDILTREGVAPEICGRINRFLVYNPLTPAAVFQIALTEMQHHALQYDLNLRSADPKLLAEIALDTSGSPYGARPISQWIRSRFGATMLQYQQAHPDSRNVILSKEAHDYRLLSAPDDAIPPRAELMAQAQTRYLRQPGYRKAGLRRQPLHVDFNGGAVHISPVADGVVSGARRITETAALQLLPETLK